MPLLGIRSIRCRIALTTAPTRRCFYTNLLHQMASLIITLYRRSFNLLQRYAECIPHQVESGTFLPGHSAQEHTNKGRLSPCYEIGRTYWTMLHWHDYSNPCKCISIQQFGPPNRGGPSPHLHWFASSVVCGGINWFLFQLLLRYSARACIQGHPMGNRS